MTGGASAGGAGAMSEVKVIFLIFNYQSSFSCQSSFKNVKSTSVLLQLLALVTQYLKRKGLNKERRRIHKNSDVRI